MVWTDVFQSVIMLAGLVIVAVIGSIEVGGLQKVWEINQKHGRIHFFEYVSWQIFIYWARMFRFIIISSAPFDLLVCIPPECCNGNFGGISFSSHSFNPDPRVRNTFWTLTMGGTIALLPVWSSSQYFVQRYLAVKTLREAKRSGLNNMLRSFSLLYALMLLYIVY